MIPVDANPESRQTEEVISVDTEDAAPNSRQEEIIPVDSEDTTPQSQHTEVILTNEIPGIGELGAIDFYNLRNVDDAAKARKKKQQMMREERIQNKRLRKERKIREAKEIVDNALRIREELYQKMLRSEAKRRENDEKLGINRVKKGGLTTDFVALPPELQPYESDNEFGTEFLLKRTEWRVEQFTLKLARCMVGLESFAGDKQLFSCSGTIIDFEMGIGYVVTSASLVRCPEKYEQADELKIDVWLPSGEKLDGSVSNVDFYYNICVVKVLSTSQLPRKSFSADTRIFNFYECHPKDVVALGRICKCCSLKFALGKLMPRRSQFDCEELLVSSCRISRRGIGGPLMDFDGNIIGMNFYDKKETPFLPSFIVLKCLQHFKDFGMIIRPLHGLRVKTLHEAPLSVLEKIQHEFPEVCGVIVEKVEVPSVEHSEIKVGDIITHVDGVPFSNAAELGGILLDTCGQHMLERQKLDLPKDGNQMATVINLQFDVKTLRGRKFETTTRTINVDKFTPTSGLNRWPLGKSYLVQRYVDGELTTKVRYC